MQITLTIPDELVAQAQARGLELEQRLPVLLAEDLACVESRMEPQEDLADRRRAAVEAMLGFAKEHGVSTGGQDIKSMIHEGHKY